MYSQSRQTDLVPVWPAWPMLGMIDDVRPALATAARDGQTVALATLFASEGGSMRGLGAQMLIGEDLLAGHLTGGCADADIAEHARQVMADGEPARLTYGKGGPWDLPLPCGGRIEVFVERIAPADPAAGSLIDFHDRRMAAIWRSDGITRRCEPDDGGEPAGLHGKGIFRRYAPPTRLIVIGGEPTALALATLSIQIGIQTILVRPGGPEAPPPVSGLGYSRASAADALARIGVDRWTAIAVCTHDADLDHDALVAALPSSAFYVGALGSIRRRRARMQSLADAGVASTDVARLRTPIGLRIGARAPFEIATAALAELIDVASAAALGRTSDAA